MTGGGALAAGRRAGLSQRGSSQVTPWIRAFHNETVKGPLPTLGYLKPLTWEDGATSYTGSGTDGARNILTEPRCPASLGTVSPAPTAGNFLADGDTIRAQAAGAEGTYTVPVIETQTDGSVASPTTKSTPLTWIVP
ncbi:hypothetical protein AB5I41_30880 [Sphingomonas sp. MMS24-JH45]